MNLALVGAGSVGSLIASALCSNGIQFDWLVRSAQRRNELLRFTANIDGSYAQFDKRLFKVLTTLDADAYDLAVLAVKAQQVRPAIEQYSLDESSTLAVTNGLHEGKYMLGLLYGGAFMEKGELVTSSSNLLRVGPIAAEGTDARLLLQAAPLLTCSWLKTQMRDDMPVLMWHKLALNCAVNALTAIEDVPNGELLKRMDHPQILSLLNEVCVVAKAELGPKWTYGGADIHCDLRDLLTRTESNSSSMRQDLKAGRETEIERLNLAVAAAGAKHGIECPENERLGRLVLAASNN